MQAGRKNTMYQKQPPPHPAPLLSNSTLYTPVNMWKVFIASFQKLNLVEKNKMFSLHIFKFLKAYILIISNKTLPFWFQIYKPGNKQVDLFFFKGFGLFRMRFTGLEHQRQVQLVPPVHVSESETVEWARISQQFRLVNNNPTVTFSPGGYSWRESFPD